MKLCNYVSQYRSYYPNGILQFMASINLYMRLRSKIWADIRGNLIGIWKIVYEMENY
jgi:hypothetical protein